MACCSGGYAAVYPWEWSKECSNKQKEDEVNIYTKMNTKVEWHMQMPEAWAGEDNRILQTGVYDMKLL